MTDDDDCKTHCFIGMTDGVVYKPKSQKTANKKVSWDLNECLRLADWRGFYLNPDPKNNMPL